MMEAKNENGLFDDNRKLVSRGSSEIIKFNDLNDVKKEEYKYLAFDEIRKLKQEFLDNYFEMEFTDFTKNGGKQRHGKSFDYVYEPSTLKSEKMINKIWGQIGHLFSDREEYMSVVMLAVSEAVRKFNEEQVNFNWENVNTVDTKENNLIHGYISKAVYNETKEAANLWQNRERRQAEEASEDGKRNRYDIYLRLGTAEMQSIDEVLNDGEGEEMFFHELLGEDAGVFYQNNSNVYEKNHFLQFFYENFDSDILTNFQREFLKVFPKYYAGNLLNAVEDYSKESEDNRPYTQNQINYLFSAIRGRFIQTFNKQFPEGMKSRLELNLEREVIFLNEMIGITKDNEIETQNERLTDFILDNLDTTVISDLLYDKMESKHVFNVVAARKGEMLKSETLYEFVTVAKDRLEDIEVIDTTIAKKFYKKDEEFLFENRAVQIENMKKRQRAEEEFQRQEKENGRNYRVEILLPSGAREQVSRMIDEDFYY